MTKQELENFWKNIIYLHFEVGLNASTMDEVYSKIQYYCNLNNIDFESLDIDY